MTQALRESNAFRQSKKTGTYATLEICCGIFKPKDVLLRKRENSQYKPLEDDFNTYLGWFASTSQNLCLGRLLRHLNFLPLHLLRLKGEHLSLNHTNGL